MHDFDDGVVTDSIEEQDEDPSQDSSLLRRKNTENGAMTDEQVDIALRKLCKCGDPFLRYDRIKEVGAG